jgi:D-galactose 1-dehydrogenase
MAKYKIGIIGFGKIARDQHAPAIQASANFELVAISNAGEGDPLKDVTSFKAYQEMVTAVSDLDAVAICTPPGPRRVIAADCLAAGKHVLLEKPPAGTVTEVPAIARAAAGAKKVAFTTYHAQHNQAVKRAADLLAGKTLRRLQVTWKEDIHRWHPGQEWILAAGGFGIFDPGINALSILTRILPEPVFISSAELYFPANRGAPIAANLKFGTGLLPNDQLTAALDWRETGLQTWEIDLEATDGTKIKLSNGGSELDVEGQPPFVGPPDEYPDIYKEFAQLLDASTSKIDASPFQLVADVFMLGERKVVEAFDF